MGAMTFKQAKEFAFGYNVSALAEYIDEQATEILTRDVLRSRTIDLAAIQTGVKHKEKIKLVDIDVNYQSGAACEINASGNAIFTDREIAVDPIAIVMKFCNNELRDKWTQLLLRAGSNAETQDLPAEQILLNHFLEKHRAQLEQNVWKGDKALPSGNLSLSNGFLKLFAANAGTLVNLNPTGATTFTASNAYDLVFAAYEAMPQAVLESGAEMFVGRAFYDRLVKNMVDQNFFFKSDIDGLAGTQSMTLWGTDLKINKVPGLNDVNEFYIAKPTELIIGTDLENDFEQVELWYEKKDDSIYMRVKFKVGTQVPFLNQIGRFALAAS